MTKKYSPLEQSKLRERKLSEGLRSLAARYGKKFREPLQIDTNGEFSLVVSNGTAHDGTNDACGKYGPELAAIISSYNPRTGIDPTSHMLPENGWCRMNHFEVERMLEREDVDVSPEI